MTLRQFLEGRSAVLLGATMIKYDYLFMLDTTPKQVARVNADSCSILAAENRICETFPSILIEATLSPCVTANIVENS